MRTFCATLTAVLFAAALVAVCAHAHRAAADSFQLPHNNDDVEQHQRRPHKQRHHLKLKRSSLHDRFSVARQNVLQVSSNDRVHSRTSEGLLASSPSQPPLRSNASSEYFVSVMDFGAVPDGVTDNTAAFRAALAAGSGSRVFVPAGQYNFLGTLIVPPSTVIEGVDMYPFRSFTGGSVLLVSYDGGNTSGTPFLFLNGPNAGINGVAILYTKQNYSAPEPIPYPPCVQGSGDDISVLNTLLGNPYVGIDLSTYPCGRHLIDNVYGQPLFLGISVDQTYDIGRIRNIHFWDFWSPYPSPASSWQQTHATAFHIARSDWEVIQDVFGFGYRHGMVFDESANGACNGQFVNIDFDDTGVGLDLRAAQIAGLLFTNVNLATDGNQPNPVAVRCDPGGSTVQAVIRGLSTWGAWQQAVRWNCSGAITVSDSLFVQWNGAYSVLEALNGRAYFRDNYFTASVGGGIFVGESVDRAVVTGNDLAGNSLTCMGLIRLCTNNLL